MPCQTLSKSMHTSSTTGLQFSFILMRSVCHLLCQGFSKMERSFAKLGICLVNHRCWGHYFSRWRDKWRGLFGGTCLPMAEDIILSNRATWKVRNFTFMWGLALVGTSSDLAMWVFWSKSGHASFPRPGCYIHGSPEQGMMQRVVICMWIQAPIMKLSQQRIFKSWDNQSFARED